MSSALDFLQLGLSRSFAYGVHSPENWTDLTGITRALAQVQREHGGAAIVADPRSIMSAITGFRRTGTISGFRDLKYVCLGIGVIDGRGWCVLSDPALRHKLAELIEGHTEWRRRVRCFQALLSSYWTFPLHDRATTDEARVGWREMRDWLRSERWNIMRSRESVPLWFAGLTRHIELLGDTPCDKFGAALLKGDFSALNDAMESLAIPNASWVMMEAILAQMKASAGLADEAFKELLPQLLPIAMGKGGVEIGDALRVRCVAQLVSRYATCMDRPEQMALRDAAVTTIGNPWLRRTNWDASVVDGSGQPDGQAREMVNGWLKRRLISDFFVLLSVDGTGDPRRLDYWLRFEPIIEDMWFALGRDAQTQRGEHFHEFRANAKGRLLSLEESTADNNAFVMRIGEYLAVEFGATGYFRLFKWSSLGPTFIDTLTSSLSRKRISHKYLRALDYEERMKHIDAASRTWEQKFDERICPLFGRRPADPPRAIGTARARASRGPTPVEWGAFVMTHKLSVEDHRARGGALWVLGGELPKGIVSKLKMWGFQQRVPRGWFKEPR